jgi:4-hydroxy-3-polyprenylbenzoate decarboxylase
MKIGVGITGASGIPLALRLVDVLKERGHALEVAISPTALIVAKVEPCDPSTLRPCDLINELRKRDVKPQISLSAPLASSSRVPDAVVIVPCSMKSLANIANGIGDTLPTRLALNALRMGKTLVIVPRETPVGTIELENMLKVSMLGVKIVFPTLAFYIRPMSIGDLIDFVVGKILDVLEIENNLYRRYGQ